MSLRMVLIGKLIRSAKLYLEERNGGSTASSGAMVNIAITNLTVRSGMFGGYAESYGKVSGKIIDYWMNL